MDRRLRAHIAAGGTQGAFAASIGCARSVVRNRMRKLGIVTAPPPPSAPRQVVAREPLPPGHPVSWGLITAGTLLDGEDYPPTVLHFGRRGG